MKAPRLHTPLLAASIALAFALAAGPARALPVDFVVDPVQSTVTVAGTLRLELGLASGPVLAPLASQVGTPGAAGNALPDGSTSDGTVTSLSGSLATDLFLAAGPGALQVLSGGLALAQSGTWFPSEADPAVPDAAQLAFAFDDGTGALAGQAALREATLGAASVLLQLTDLGPTEAALLAGSQVAWQLGSIALDVASTLGDFRRTLPSLLVESDVSGGTLESLGGGLHRLTMPIAVETTYDPSDLNLPLPLFLDLTLTGQLVATATLVPEPAVGALLAFSFLGLARPRTRKGA